LGLSGRELKGASRSLAKASFDEDTGDIIGNKE
jgi:hypothetical protein